MKRLILLVLILFLPQLIFGQNDYENSIFDSLRYIDDMPYICHELEKDMGKISGCGDIVFWKTVKQKLNIVEPLIDLIDDTTETLAPVPNFGGKYTVGDVAYVALSEIIQNIPTFELLGVEYDKDGCGFCTYWKHLRKNFENRVKFKYAIKNWYNTNIDKFVWITSNKFGTCDCGKNHPNGGHYEVKNQ